MKRPWTRAEFQSLKKTLQKYRNFPEALAAHNLKWDTNRSRNSAELKIRAEFGAYGQLLNREPRPPLPAAKIRAGASVTELAILRDKIRTLEAALRAEDQNKLDAEHVKRQIIGLAAKQPDPPAWVLRPPSGKPRQSVPTLFLSDLHWGEVVDPRQIGGVNRYNIQIAHERVRECVRNAVHLLHGHLNPPEYPGIVLALGGDMISGTIHEELSETNERAVMACVLDLLGVMVWVVDTMAEKFKNVFIPAVTGNHARTTLKIRKKDRAFTSFDWLLYQFLAKRYENDARVRFLIPDGPDAYYRVFGHRYLLTHGDQFRGGDGMIGALGPIMRGDHKKRSRNSQVRMDYDTMLLAHWHQRIHLRRLIVNGSLVGYNEYAYDLNLAYEPPQQSIWLTHPDHGITISAPVHVGRASAPASEPWVSWSSR